MMIDIFSLYNEGPFEMLTAELPDGIEQCVGINTSNTLFSELLQGEYCVGESTSLIRYGGDIFKGIWVDEASKWYVCIGAYESKEGNLLVPVEEYLPDVSVSLVPFLGKALTRQT